MKLGIDTGYFADLALLDALERLAALGWRYVQISAGHLCPKGGPVESPESIRRACERLGVTVWQVHSDAELGPLPEHVDANLRWVDLAAALGARCLITHANQQADYNTDDDRRRCLDLNRGCLARLAGRAADAGVRVALENRLERPWAKCRRFGARVRDFLDLIDAAGAPAVGVCLDTSHTRVSRLAFADEIAACGPRLLATQISDSDGQTQHRMPFTLDIDWAGFVSALRAADYRGLLTLDAHGAGESVEELSEELTAVRRRFGELLGEGED